jgi:hypothetical protein
MAKDSESATTEGVSALAHEVADKKENAAIKSIKEWYANACSKEAHGVLSGALQVGESRVDKQKKKFESYVRTMAEDLKDSLNQRESESETEYEERRKRVAEKNARSLLTLIGKESVMEGSKLDKTLDKLEQEMVKLVNGIVNTWNELKKNVKEYWHLPWEEKVTKLSNGLREAGKEIAAAWTDFKESCAIELESIKIGMEERQVKNFISKKEQANLKALASLQLEDLPEDAQSKASAIKDAVAEYKTSALSKVKSRAQERRSSVSERKAAVKSRREERKSSKRAK